MSEKGLSEALTHLLHRHLPTMDHVSLLLALREQPQLLHAPAALAVQSRLDRAVTEKVLRDLEASQLVRQEKGEFIYAPTAVPTNAIDELAEMNRTRPVTLIRALYDRPSRAARSFADAFRLRKTED